MCTKRTLIILSAIAISRCIFAQEVVTERLAGHELLEVRHAEQRVSLPVDPLSVDSLVEVRSLEVNMYNDTLRTITTRQDTVVEEAPASRKGHYVEIHGGAGIGNVGYGFLRKDLQLPDNANMSATGYEQAAVSGVVQLQYAYFFHPNVGIGVGAWLSNYTSHGYLSGDILYPGVKKQADGTYVPDIESGIVDSDGEYYNHHATVSNWRERQTIHTVGVPVSLQIQAWGKKDKAGFFMSLGAAPAYTVMSNYHVVGGEVEHWGAYPHRGGAELHDTHEFETINYAGKRGKQSVKQFTATAFMDLGLLVKMSKHTDFLIGVYGHYAVMDIQNATLTDIGWKTDKFPKLNMQPYCGILPTKCVAGSALRPWQAGVKIGVHWHSVDKPRTRIVQHADTTLQTIARNDSVWTSRIDTLQRVIPREVEQVQEQIDKLNRIYFAFDSYELTDESKHFLSQIAEHLKRIPNKIILGGHASKEGTRAHNARLAHYRALQVKYYLVDCGIPATRMKIEDYGSSVRNAINLSEDLSLDRRVEIIVADE